ncbi:hypothetical protein HDE_00530 [Halotydeus destructor]|nr:hypothetical protein HDE_00530 [Halotydeus destructor]
MLVIFLNVISIVETLSEITYVSKCGEPPVMPYMRLVDSGQRLQGSTVIYDCPLYVEQCRYGVWLECAGDSLWKGQVTAHSTPLFGQVALVNVSCPTDQRALQVEHDSFRNEPHVKLHDHSRGKVSNENLTCADSAYHWEIQLREPLVIAVIRLEVRATGDDPTLITVDRMTTWHEKDGGETGVLQIPENYGASGNGVSWYKYSTAQESSSFKISFITSPDQLLTLTKLVLAGRSARCTFPQVAPYAKGVPGAGLNFTVGSHFEIECDPSAWSTVETGYMTCPQSRISVIKHPKCIPKVSCPQLLAEAVSYIGSVFSNGQNHIVAETVAEVKCQYGRTDRTTCVNGQWNDTLYCLSLGKSRKKYPYGYTRCGEPPTYEWARAHDHGGRSHGDVLSYKSNSFLNQCVNSFDLHCTDGIWSRKTFIDAPPLLVGLVMVNVSCGQAYRVFYVDEAEQQDNPFLLYSHQDGVNISTENIPCYDGEKYHWNIHFTNKTRIGYLRLEMNKYVVSNISTAPYRTCKSHGNLGAKEKGYFKCPLKSNMSDLAIDSITIITHNTNKPIQLLKLFMAGPADHCGKPQRPPYLQWDKQLDGQLQLGQEMITQCKATWNTLRRGLIRCNYDGSDVVNEPTCVPKIRCPELAPVVKGVSYTGRVRSGAHSYIVHDTQAKVRCQGGQFDIITCIHGAWETPACLAAISCRPMDGVGGATYDGQIHFNGIVYLLSNSTASRACEESGLYMTAKCLDGQWSNQLSCDLGSSESPPGVTLAIIAGSAALVVCAVVFALKKVKEKKTDVEPSYFEPTFAHAAHIGGPSVPISHVDPAYAQVDDIYDSVRYVSYHNAVAMV